MTTAQLTVLWYAGILISGILLIDDLTAYRFIAVVILFASLAIYSLRPHPQAKKRLLPLTVLGPFAAVGLLLYGWITYGTYQHQTETNLVELDKVVITNAHLEKVSNLESGIESLSYAYLTGTLQNLSYDVLTNVTVEVDLQMRGVGAIQETINVVVPPGQSVQFHQKVDFFLPEMALPDQSVPIELRPVGTTGKMQ